MVFQDFQIFSLPFAQNVLMKIPENDEERNCVIKALEKAQKIAIARVFAKDCDIAILDEPSSALDPIAEFNMYNNMMEASNNKTVIFISHRLSSARMADKIYMFEKGRIIEQGTHSELMSLNQKYAEMFNLQAKNYREEEAMRYE